MINPICGNIFVIDLCNIYVLMILNYVLNDGYVVIYRIHCQSESILTSLTINI